MHSKKEILKALEYSKDARLSTTILNSKYQGSIFIEDKNTDTQGFAYMNGKEAVFAFRGTQQLKDWLTDFNAFHMVFPYGNLDTKIMVHRGFMMAYLSIRDKVHSFMNTYKSDIKRIVCCGHSLGGALATLCAVDLQYNFKCDVNCLVSGNPMVGNKYFVESFNKRVPKTTRTFMRKDIVPKLPPEWFESKVYEGYSHCGIPLAIGPRSPFFGIITWFKKLTHKSDGFFDDLFNHDIDTYNKEVTKLNID